ncbi:MAG TPA: hypothetical protein VF048_09100 [Gemmatimonadaceae bacterium]
MILWSVLMLGMWVGIPLAIGYGAWRFLRAYERRTAAMVRVEAMELRLARLEARLAPAEAPRPHA